MASAYARLAANGTPAPAGVGLVFRRRAGFGYSQAIASTPPKDPTGDPDLPPRAGPGRGAAWGLPLVWVLLVLALAHGPPLLMRGLYWDDWWIVGAPEASVLKNYRESGTIRTGYLHALFNRLPGNRGATPGKDADLVPWRLTNLLGLLGTAFFLWRILELLPEVRREARTMLVLLFLVFPVNPTRFLVILTLGHVTTMAYLAGAWCYAQSVRTGSRRLRALAFPLFVLGFWTPSLLVFHLLTILLVARLEWPARRLDGASLVGWFWTHAGLLLVPVAYFGVEKLVFPATGVYAGYNTVGNLRTALTSPGIWLGIFQLNIAGSLGAAVRALTPGAAMTVLLLAGAAARVQAGSHGPEAEEATPPAACLGLLALGVLAFVVAVFPYMAVGKYPMPGWHDGISMKFVDRFQFLIPLSGALLAYYCLEAPVSLGKVPARVRTYLCWLLVFSCCHWFHAVYGEFQRDWVKQRGLVAHLRVAPEVAAHRTFLVSDPGRQGNAFGRFLRFFEYTGLMRLATGTQVRFAMDEEWKTLRAWLVENFRVPGYHFADYRPGPPEVRLLVHTDLERLGARSGLGWWWLEVTRPDDFEAEAARVVEVRYQLIDEVQP